MIIILGAIAGVIGCGITAWTDWKEYRISNQLIAWMFAVGLVFATWRYFHPLNEFFEYKWGSVVESVLIGFGIAITLLIMRLGYDGLRASLKKESKPLVGGGDIKLLLCISFFFPTNAYLLILLATCVLILVIEPIRTLKFKKKYFAFAPYVFAASVLIVTFGTINTFHG